MAGRNGAGGVMLAERAHEEYTVRPFKAAREHARLSWLPVIVGLVVADSLALTTAFALAYVVRFKTEWRIFQEAVPSVDFYLFAVVWALPVWLCIFLFCRLYDHRCLF